jgi:hypothetical protein
MSMPDAVNCERVEREELDLRYLRGALPEPLAEAFEAHYFGCDACWALVRRGNDLRAARPSPGAARWPRSRTLGLAAVLVAAVGLGFWRMTRSEAPGVTAPSLERGGSAAVIALEAGATDGLVSARWSRVPLAAGYRIRCFGPDGGLLLQRQTPDTALTVPRDSLRVGSTGPLVWQVQALDRLGGELARSALIEGPSAAPPR